MFKPASWRSEKKIKAVFIMQFQATQVPQLKAKKLTISLIPADVGKPTVRLGKAKIFEGTCSWENPIYETVKLIKETKTGILRAKIYHFVVSTGSSKSGYFGEASVDFAYLLEATKPVMLSLPLQASDSGAILHVTIQKLEGTLDQRCFEDESATTISYDRSLEMDLEDTDKFEKRNTAFTEEEEENITTPYHPNQIGSFQVPQSENTTAYPDFADTADNMDKKASDSDQMLLNQIKMLERQAEVSELELQSLRKQMLKESRKVEELSRDIVCLQKERDVLKAQCEGQKSSPESTGETEVSNNSHLGTAKLIPISEKIKQELQREKHLNRKLRSQLQRTEDSNSELILAVKDLKEMLNKKNREISHLSGKIKDNQDDPEAPSEALRSKMDQNGETNALEKLVEEQSRKDEVEVLKQNIKNLNTEIELSRKEKEEINMCLQLLSKDYEILKKEKTEIYSDLQKKQMSVMEMQHEHTISLATMKQLKLQQKKLEEEVKKQKLLSSKYLVAINDLETQVQSLEGELEKQGEDFEDDLKAVTQAKVEQEQRARQAEETLEKVDRSNVNLVEHLKAEFTRASKELAFEINEKEKLALKAVAEANDLLLQKEHLEKFLQETKDELELIKDVYERKLQDLSLQIYSEVQHTGQLLSLDIDNKNTKLEILEGHGNDEAQPTDNQKIKGERRQQVEKVCNEEVKQREEYEKEHKEMPLSESEILKRWSDEKEELKRELISARKEAEKLFEENISLRTQIDEKKRIDEIWHSDMEKLSVHHNEQIHSSLEVNLESETLKSQVFKLKQNDLHNNEQVTRLIKDTIMHGRRLEDKRSIGENMRSRELGIFKGNTAEIGFFTTQRKSNATHAGEAVEMDSGQANNICDLAKLLDEVSMLKEQNKQKEVDLKEMQERYSEISLKFAEVEGERQQLVMALRNLKNGKKK